MEISIIIFRVLLGCFFAVIILLILLALGHFSRKNLEKKHLKPKQNDKHYKGEQVAKL